MRGIRLFPNPIGVPCIEGILHVNNGLLQLLQLLRRYRRHCYYAPAAFLALAQAQDAACASFSWRCLYGRVICWA